MIYLYRNNFKGIFCKVIEVSLVEPLLHTWEFTHEKPMATPSLSVLRLWLLLLLLLLVLLLYFGGFSTCFYLTLAELLWLPLGPSPGLQRWVLQGRLLLAPKSRAPLQRQADG